MRLTKKELMNAINQPMCFGSRLVGKKMFAQIIEELCEYKTIEEELGIDLIKLFKAIKDGVYIKDGYRQLHYPNEKWAIYEINLNVAYFQLEICVALFERYKGIGNRYERKNREYCPFNEIKKSSVVGLYERNTVYFKDYGKTWALTKEELE